VKREPVFKSEADLCAVFIAEVEKKKDWTAYAETAGWDILLVRISDGCQIGIQAKLKLNAKVLTQAAEGRWDRESGPDYRACLIPPYGSSDLSELAFHCRLTLIQMRAPQPHAIPWFWPQLPFFVTAARTDCDSGDDNNSWFEMMPTQRCQLPDYIPDVRAGSAAPIQLTRWKVSALRLAVLLDQTGYLTRADFKAHQIDIRRWTDGRWIVPGDRGFVAGDRFPGFRLQHPVVWDQIVADSARWKRKMEPEPLMRFRQQEALT
jgi:hypothetical protein